MKILIDLDEITNQRAKDEAIKQDRSKKKLLEIIVRDYFKNE